MTQYIDKDALVAEIEKLIPLPTYERETLHSEFVRGKRIAYNNILDLLDTLEVKEVDLEKYYHDFLQKEWFDKNCSRTVSEMMAFTAKHFFELGLKAQKDDIRHSMNETPNYPCDILLVTNVDNMFLFKYMENGRPVDRETPYFHNIQNGKCWYYCNDIMNIH